MEGDVELPETSSSLPACSVSLVYFTHWAGRGDRLASDREWATDGGEEGWEEQG